MDDYVMQCELKAELPWQVLGNKDLYCEPLAKSHLNGFEALWADEEVIKYTNIQKPCSRTDSEMRLKIFLDNQKDLKVPTIFTVFYRGEICGMAGCPVIDEQKGEFGFFYQIHSSWWGQGIGSECAVWILSYMRSHFQNLTLYADVVEANIASVKILLKLGFTEAARHENAFARCGEIWDVVDYAFRQVENTGCYDS